MACLPPSSFSLTFPNSSAILDKLSPIALTSSLSPSMLPVLLAISITDPLLSTIYKGIVSYLIPLILMIFLSMWFELSYQASISSSGEWSPWLLPSTHSVAHSILPSQHIWLGEEQYHFQVVWVFRWRNWLVLRSFHCELAAQSLPSVISSSAPGMTSQLMKVQLGSRYWSPSQEYCSEIELTWSPCPSWILPLMRQ